MTGTVLELWNRALASAGGQGRVTSELEASRERELCSLFYPLALDTVQESAYWPVCRTYAALTLVDSAEDTWAAGNPPSGYLYSFSLPNDMLRPWHLMNFATFELGYDKIGSRQVLYTNTLDPVLLYARRSTSVTEWSSVMTQATVYGLSGQLAEAMRQPQGVQQLLWQKANILLNSGASIAANSDETYFNSNPEWLTARGGIPSTSASRFIYPAANGFSTNG